MWWNYNIANVYCTTHITVHSIKPWCPSHSPLTILTEIPCLYKILYQNTYYFLLYSVKYTLYRIQFQKMVLGPNEVYILSHKSEVSMMNCVLIWASNKVGLYLFNMNLYQIWPARFRATVNLSMLLLRQKLFIVFILYPLQKEQNSLKNVWQCMVIVSVLVITSELIYLIFMKLRGWPCHLRSPFHMLK